MQSRPALSAHELASFLSAHLCHEVASPVAAIGAAMGVLDDPQSADMREEAITLLRSSAAQAHARVEFARLAYGPQPASMTIPLAELQRVIGDMFSEKKVEFTWRAPEGEPPRPVASLIANLTLIGVNALPRGGTVLIEAGASGERLHVTAEGPRARLEDWVIACLEGRAPEGGFDGRRIQPYFAGLLAREAGGRASARIDGERVEIAALAPVLGMA